MMELPEEAPMARRILAPTLAALLTLAVSGCARVPMETTSASKASTSTSFSFATYKEQDGPITLLVGTFLASLNDAEPYFPLQIAVGVRGEDAKLTVTPESFLLIDPDGKAYPLASYREIVEQDHLLQRNADLNEAQPLQTGEQFTNSSRIASNFFPTVAGGIVIDRVHLRRTTYIKDMLYFPRPDHGLDGTHTLRFRTAEMTRPIDVRFEIPLKVKKKKRNRG
jgi:hypothetical protein